MAWKPYDYTPRTHRASGRTKVYHRPLLDIDVWGVTGPERFTALIDSGTELTVMSTEVAQLLDITSRGKQQVQVSTFGSTVPGYVAEVRIVVPGFPKEVLTTNVIFSDSVSNGTPYDILLGQEDFFSRFLIKFEKRKNKFYIKLP